MGVGIISFGWIFNPVDFLEKLQKKKKIGLYGAGWYGKIFFSYLKKYNLSEKVVAFIVSNAEDNPLQIENVPVIPLDKLERQYDLDILVTIAERKQEEIKKYLSEHGYENIQMVDEVFLCMVADEIKNL